MLGSLVLMTSILVNGATHEVSAAVTTMRAVYKLVDVDPENNLNHFNSSRIDLRLVRNEAFDVLVDATKIVGAATDGDHGGDFDGSSGCAIQGGDLWCWGVNRLGRLGDGTTTASAQPKLILAGVKDFFTSTRYTCAVKNNGDLVCAGGSGPYGTPIITSFSSPIATGVAAINDGGWPCITRVDGSSACAGNFRGAGGNPDGFVPSTWTWHDTGLRSSGEIVQGSLNPPYSGGGVGRNVWDDDRVMCTLNLGRVSCVQMTNNNATTHVPTFSQPSEVEGVSDATDLYVLGGAFGTSYGMVYVYANGILYRADRPVGSGPPRLFTPIGSMQTPVGMIPTPMGVSSMGSPAFLFESGIGTLNFDPITKFEGSSVGVSNTIVRVTGRSSLFQIIPMEVVTGDRGTRTSARLRITAGGSPVVGATIAWRPADIGGSAVSSTSVPLTTDYNGWIEIPTISKGPVTFEIQGGVSGSFYMATARSTVVVPASGDIVVDVPTPLRVEKHTLTVVTRAGLPVPSAVVTITNLFRMNQTTATSNGAVAWTVSKPRTGYFLGPTCPQCLSQEVSLITGEDGRVDFTVFGTSLIWKKLDFKNGVTTYDDFVVSYDDGSVQVEVPGLLTGSEQTVKLPLDASATVVGSRDVAAVRGKGASIRVSGSGSDLMAEEICDVMVTGGLWSNTKRFDQRSCSNGAIKKTGLIGVPSARLGCSGASASRSTGRVTVCPRTSMFVRMRTPGKAGTRSVCVIVGGRPCLTRQSATYGVPKVLRIGKSIALRSLVPTSKRTSVTATVATSSKSRCEVNGTRVLSKKSVGECNLWVSARTGSRVVVYQLPVLVAR